MNRRQTFACLAVIAVTVSSAAAQDAGFAASAIANDNGTTTVITAPAGGAAAVGVGAGDNGTTTIILGPGGGATTFTVTGVAQLGDNAAPAKVTYLGVSTSPPPEALTDQLKLPKGIGLLVDFVDAKSPAAAAGIRKNDVLTRLDDQLLTSPQHLAVLVRMHKPKDKVAVTLLREAREEKVTAELGESEEAAREVDFGLQPIAPQPTARGNAMQQVFSRMNAGGGAATTSSASFSDGEHSLTVTTSGREKHLLARDRDGNVLYNGPVTTEEQRKAVPPEVLKKFQTMEQSMRVEVRGDGAASAIAIMGNAGGGFLNAIPFAARRFGQPSGQGHTWSDNEHNLTVTTRDRGKYLTVADRNGAVLWEGFIRTDAEQKAVPPEFLPKLEKLEAKVREESRGTVSLIEDGLTVTLTTDSGRQSVVAREADGKVIFEGPVDTEDQRAKMPEKVRTKLEKLWKSCAAVWQSSQD